MQELEDDLNLKLAVRIHSHVYAATVMLKELDKKIENIEKAHGKNQSFLRSLYRILRDITKIVTELYEKNSDLQDQILDLQLQLENLKKE